MSRSTELAVEQSKLVDYLLNLEHGEGASKARYFIALGFDPTDPEKLAAALISQAIEGWPGQANITAFGLKHVIDGQLQTPAGSSVDLRSVWQIQSDHRAWLVTAYPIR